MKFFVLTGMGLVALLLLLLRAGYHWIASIYQEADDILEQ